MIPVQAQVIQTQGLGLLIGATMTLLKSKEKKKEIIHDAQGQISDCLGPKDLVFLKCQC